MTDIQDVTDEPRSHTVDEIIAAAEGQDPSEQPQRASFDAGEPPAAISAIDAVEAFYGLVAGHSELIDASIERLVRQRSRINDEIRVLREAKTKADRMARIASEE